MAYTLVVFQIDVNWRREEKFVNVRSDFYFYLFIWKTLLLSHIDDQLMLVDHLQHLHSPSVSFAQVRNSDGVLFTACLASLRATSYFPYNFKVPSVTPFVIRSQMLQK